MTMLTELVLMVGVPAILATVWKQDNRIQALEFRVQILEREHSRRWQQTGKAIAQLAGYLEHNTSFSCRSHTPDGEHCWPSDDPPTGIENWD